MKNILYISVLLLAFSCGGEAKTYNNSAKTASLPTETEQNQTISDVKDTPISKEGKTKVLAESKIEEEVTSKETTADLRVENVSSKPINSSKSKTEKNTKPSTVKNEAEAKAQLEAEKAKSLAEKMHLEEACILENLKIHIIIAALTLLRQKELYNTLINFI